MNARRCLALLAAMATTMSLLVLASPAGPASAQTALRPASPVSLGAVPADVALGDVDADGDLDQLLTFDDDSTLALLRNDGAGFFAAPVRSALPDDEGAVVAADLDQDGAADAVVAPAFNPVLAVLPGTPGGGLGTARIYPIPRYADDLTVGDMNGDGRLDIAAASRSGGAVYILLTAADGTLGAPIATSVRSPREVAVGDVTSDGIADAVVAPDRDVGEIFLLRGNGDGTLRPPVTVLTERGADYARLADMDGDGRLDLVAGKSGDSGKNTLVVALGDGTGGFVRLQTVEPVYDAGAVRDLAIVDLDGDGRTDVVTGSATRNDVAVLRGDGSGGLTRTAVVPAGGPALDLQLADVDGDADLDAVVAQPGAVRTLLGNGSGGLVAGPVVSIPGTPTYVEVGDLDGDSLPDLAVGTASFGGLRLARGDGAGGFTLVDTLFDGLTIRGLAVADLDGDGPLDLAVVQQGGGFGMDGRQVLIRYGDGSGGFARSGSFPGGGARGLGLVAADATGDGVLDLITSATVLPGDPSGGFGAPLVSAETLTASFAVNDVDGDADLDRVLPGWAGALQVRVQLGLGNGFFQPEIGFLGGSSPAEVAVGDLDGTGLPDVVAADSEAGAVAVLSNRTVATPGDLAVQFIGFDPAVVPGGRRLAITEATVNVGDQGVGPSRTRFLLAYDRALVTTVALPGSRQVQALSPDEATRRLTMVTVPADALAGYYYVAACADADAAVVENDERNNCLVSSSTVRIGPPGPDLENFANRRDFGAVPPGGRIEIQVRTNNRGTLAAGASTTRGLLSTDDVLSDDDVLLAEADAVPRLAVDASDLGTLIPTIPRDTEPGRYRVFVCSDYDDVVAETDETDNCSFPVSVTVEAP